MNFVDLTKNKEDIREFHDGVRTESQIKEYAKKYRAENRKKKRKPFVFEISHTPMKIGV